MFTSWEGGLRHSAKCEVIITLVKSPTKRGRFVKGCKKAITGFLSSALDKFSGISTFLQDSLSSKR